MTTAMNTAITDAAPDLIQAGIKSINGLDASRRVAWAKMYEALRQGEQAERDLETAREDKILLSRFGGFSYGVMESLGLTDIYREYLNGDCDALSCYFEQGAVNAGRDSGRRWRDRLPEVAELLKERKRVAREHQQFFYAATSHALGILRKQFGFDTMESVIDYLAESPTHDCDECGCYQTEEGSCFYHFGPKGCLIWGPIVNAATKMRDDVE